MNADNVTFYGDEDGWHMTVTTSDGQEYDFNVHDVAWDLAAHADATLGAYRREGERARGTMPPHITEDDLDAYVLGSAKRITLEREWRRQHGKP